MKSIAWVVGGFVLLGLSGMIEAVGDTGATPEARLPLYFVALAVLLGAPLCFFMALRSILAARSKGKPAPGAPRPAERMAQQPDATETDQFDPDAAFARYMEKRASQAAGPQSADAAGQDAAPAPRPTFGRKTG